MFHIGSTYFLRHQISSSSSSKASGYKQAMPQSQITDQRLTPQGRGIENRQIS